MTRLESLQLGGKFTGEDVDHRKTEARLTVSVACMNDHLLQHLDGIRYQVRKDDPKGAVGHGIGIDAIEEAHDVYVTAVEEIDDICTRLAEGGIELLGVATRLE